ncbi:PIG-L family deacetylase [Kocuria sp. cx-455]|uniref:PIG-L deacetylase family protein n=1 Tax=Kocuria sp. cx-455 TaxID=2771377 RepID=UPI001688B2E3|nr:PIG-L family deacetylase [Kocuria sp. cx-455]MBD2766208.1 PIG-L family deacetylase [Kocuria sp. cx-455]
MPTVLLLHAHPDDEVFANFGWAADLSSRGYDVVGAIATGGEASELHEVDSLEDARARRIAKYEAVLELLGGRSWSWLDESAGWVDAPSGPTVSGAAPQHLRAAVEHLISKTQPDIVLTVGSDGLTGHPDHVVVGTAVAAARNAVEVSEGVWGSRLRADDVRAATALVGSHTRGGKVGSGRVVGTSAPLLTRDVRSSANLRRRALDLYRDGLGTDSLESIVRSAPRVGDSVLLRGIFDLTEWSKEHYDTENQSSVAARHSPAW